MAERVAFIEETYGRTHRATWSNLRAGDAGLPQCRPGAVGCTAQVTGELGTATVVIEGSLEATPTQFFTLKDPQGNDLAFQAPGGDIVNEGVMHVRPRVAGGDRDTDVSVIVLFRSGK